jgi:hypothetical protein
MSDIDVFSFYLILLGSPNDMVCNRTVFSLRKEKIWFLCLNHSIGTTEEDGLVQWFSTFVRPRPGKFFLYRTRARSQQIYS